MTVRGIMVSDLGKGDVGAGCIPQFGDFLPFVNQMRRFALENGGNVDLDEMPVLEVAG